MANMREEQLINHLASLTDAGMSNIESTVSSLRSDLLARYHGSYKGKVKEGGEYSTYNTEEVYETVERVMAPLVKALNSGRGIVDFKPINSSDVSNANFETKVVNHLMNNANGGSSYLALYSFLKESVLYPNSYIYVDAETAFEPKGRIVHGVTEEEIAILLDTSGITLTETLRVYRDEQTGVELYDIKYTEARSRTRLITMALPPEDVVYKSKAASPLAGDLDFIGFRSKKTYSDLLKAGYEKKKLDRISSYSSVEDRGDLGEKVLRYFYSLQDSFNDGESSDSSIWEYSKAEKEYVLWRFWLYIDYDKDGISEYRRIHIAGDQVLLNEETDYCPISSMSLIINPHTHVGRSPAQSVVPIARARTAMTRTLFDSIYGGQGKTFIDVRGLVPGDVTTNALYSRSVPYVYMQGTPGDKVLKVPSDKDIPGMLTLINQLKDEASLRTGTPMAQMPEVDKINNVKTGAMEGVLKQASERTELLIRTAAETGFRSLGRLIHQLCRRFPELIDEIEINGEWHKVRAQDWPERYNVSVKAGFGAI